MIYSNLTIIASILILAWIFLMFYLIRYLIHKYQNNFGLSEEEWKSYYPELYCEAHEMENYLQKNRQLKERYIEEDEETGYKRFYQDIPKENPYQTDSFGLPPGTIRGILALTALYLFVLIETLNLFSTENLELRFSELITAFQMIIAFYFGSRALDVLKSKEESKREVKSKTNNDESSASTETAAYQKTDPSQVSKKKLTALNENETALLPIEHHESRKENVITTEKILAGKAIKDMTIETRILALTASFETGKPFPQSFAGLSGNFDGMGISAGALQWNIGKGSLMPLFADFQKQYSHLFSQYFGTHEETLKTLFKATIKEQMAWALSIQLSQTKNGKTIWILLDEWKSRIQDALSDPHMIAIQCNHAEKRMQIAKANMTFFSCESERALALFFDINVQNGRVDVKGVGDRIAEDFKKIPESASKDQKEEARLVAIANRRADVALKQWQNDVRSRKLCIANGAGIVHGHRYDLENDFGIRLRKLYD